MSAQPRAAVKVVARTRLVTAEDRKASVQDLAGARRVRTAHAPSRYPAGFNSARWKEKHKLLYSHENGDASSTQCAPSTPSLSTLSFGADRVVAVTPSPPFRRALSHKFLHPATELEAECPEDDLKASNSVLSIPAEAMRVPTPMPQRAPGRASATSYDPYLIRPDSSNSVGVDGEVERAMPRLVVVEAEYVDPGASADAFCEHEGFDEICSEVELPLPVISFYVPQAHPDISYCSEDQSLSSVGGDLQMYGLQFTSLESTASILLATVSAAHDGDPASFISAQGGDDREIAEVDDVHREGDTVKVVTVRSLHRQLGQEEPSPACQVEEKDLNLCSRNTIRREPPCGMNSSDSKLNHTARHLERAFGGKSREYGGRPRRRNL
jgi:hypothetical protein